LAARRLSFSEYHLVSRCFTACVEVTAMSAKFTPDLAPDVLQDMMVCEFQRVHLTRTPAADRRPADVQEQAGPQGTLWSGPANPALKCWASKHRQE